METPVRIGIIGDFNTGNPTHWATNAGIEHAAGALGLPFETVWLPTAETHDFASFHGIFCSPGSPYRSLDGALVGIRFARENKVPFLGTCAGLQHLVIEYARNVMGFREAAHAESDPYASCLFIVPLSCSLVGKSMEVHLKPGSKAAEVYGAERATENYYCNFGLNPDYRGALESAGLEVTGTDQDNEVRVMELSTHPFFVGTLFVPQARSEPGKPHPLVLEFCRRAMARG